MGKIRTMFHEAGAIFKTIGDRWSQFWSRWRRRPLKHKIFSAAAVGVLIAVVYVLIGLLAVSRSETHLAALKDSWEREKICHEDCGQRRRLSEEKIVAALVADPDLKSRTAERLKLYLLDENAITEFRTELIKMLRRADGSGEAAVYLKDYLLNGDNVVIRAAILDFYGAAAFNDESLDNLFGLLSGRDELSVRQAAVRALSNYQNKETDFKAEQLSLIEEIILNVRTERRLRSDLTMLLGDYYPLWPEETATILLAIYERREFGDEVSRAFAADIYNRFHGVADELPEPTVSDAAWDEYFNN